MLRRLAGDDPAVNEEWNCDKGRWGFRYATAFDRITTPLVRDAKTGELREASWSEALLAAAEGLQAAEGAGGVGVLTGGRLTVEDAYAYAKFARVALGTNDIDFRARPLSGEEADFLAVHGRRRHRRHLRGRRERAGRRSSSGSSRRRSARSSSCGCARATARTSCQVTAVAPFLSRGFEKLGATLVAAVPGDEARLLAERPDGGRAR